MNKLYNVNVSLSQLGSSFRSSSSTVNVVNAVVASGYLTGPVGPAGPKGDTGATGPAGAAGTPGATGPQGPTGPQGVQGTPGAPGATGANGTNGTNGAAATITVGTTTTGAAGSSASVANSGSSSAAVFNFTIPKGDKGDTGATGAAGVGTSINLVHYAQKNLTGSSLTALTGAVDGTNATFTVPDAVYAAGTLFVYQNGVLQPLGDAITQTTPGSGIFTFVTPPASGDQLMVAYQTAVTSGTNLATVAYSGDYNDLINKPAGGGGAVASVNGNTGTVVLTQDSIGDGTTYKQYSATEKTKLAAISGSNTGDQTSVTGNAGTATTLATGRTIAITGDLAYTSPSFNGSANVTAAGTLATVNSNVGTFGSASSVSVHTVNAKGLTTAASSTPIQITESQVTNLTSDLAAKADLVGGVVPTSQIPSLALVTVQTAASQAAQLALTTQQGDVVVRTDTNVTYMRNAGVTGTMTDFTLLNTPTDAVTSVNTQTGAVVLGKADIGLGNVDNTSDVTKNAATVTLTNKTISGASNTLSNIPESAVTNLTTDLAAAVHKTGAESITGVKTFGDQISATITGASAAEAAVKAVVDTSTAVQPAILAKNNTNFAHAANIVYVQMLNASDSGDVVRIDNAGTGKNISSRNGTTETFSVDKTGAILSGGVAVPTVSSTSTLTNKKIVKRVVALTDGATITPNADTTDIGTVTMAGSRTLAAPSGTPVDGQQLQLRLRQDATGTRVTTWNAIYRFPGGTVDTPFTAANKTDYYLFEYNATDSVWDRVAFIGNL